MRRMRQRLLSAAKQACWACLGLILISSGNSYSSDDTVLRPLPADSWRLVTDGVMGGLSTGELRREQRAGRECVCLLGDVRTENNGGFIQMALELDPAIAAEAVDYAGLRFDVLGNGESYNMHLRTSDLWLPWQSYRATFDTTPEWRTQKRAFALFEPYRTSKALRTQNLRRVGIVAMGHAFKAEVCVAGLALYRERR